MPREHGADGTYVETTPRERVFDVFDDVEGPVILSADVADALGVSRETARRKLAELYERGELDRRKVSRRVIYWRPREAAHGDADGFDAADLQGDASTTLADDADAHADESGRVRQIIDVDDLSLDRDLTDARRSHLEAWIRHAADADKVQKADFKEWWTDDRAGETGYNAGSFWEAFAKAAMKQSDQFTKPNNRAYRYIGDTGDMEGDADND